MVNMYVIGIKMNKIADDDAMNDSDAYIMRAL